MRIAIIKLWKEMISPQGNLALQNDYFLKDIGLIHHDVGREFNRRFWHV